MSKQDSTNAAWLQLVLADWQLIADVAFADLVLWVPDRTQMKAMAHARPSAAATLFFRDIVGNNPRADWQEVIDQAWESGEPAIPEGFLEFEGLTSRLAAFPVFAADKKEDSKPIAVITRHTNLSEPRIPNKLQLNFLSCANELLAMVASGDFPSTQGGLQRSGSPRAPDGLIRLDQSGRVLFASPNALSVFNRAGVEGELEGRLLAESVTPAQKKLTTVDEGLPLVLTGKGAWRTDLEFENQTVALRSIPVISRGERTGAIVLCRDVTQIRDNERELITKDLTIREIHHRVKNNLQTVASLLRIQSRQSKSQEVKDSLNRAMQRVNAIAVVHDVLSEGIEQEISFDAIFQRILTLVPETAAGYHATVKTQLEGTFGELAAERATPLALALTELVTNAVEHGLGDKSGTVSVSVTREKNHMTVTVTDDGSGLPEGKVGSGLGTQIIRSLVESELRGKILWTSPIRGGTKVVIDIPV
ncbi:MAG: hypothetical protein RIR89_751 [Actinomycetota bacterium]